MLCGHSGGAGWWGCKTASANAECAPTLPAPEKPLSAEARQAVLRALDDEYRAQAFYRAVLAKFPYALPFLPIAESEERHAIVLSRILDVFGAQIPPNPHLDSAEILASVPGTLAQACEAAIADEIANDRLYAEELMPAVADFPAIAQIFEALMRASRECHLPAFRSFAEAYRMERPLTQAPT